MTEERCIHPAYAAERRALGRVAYTKHLPGLKLFCFGVSICKHGVGHGDCGTDAMRPALPGFLRYVVPWFDHEDEDEVRHRRGVGMLQVAGGHGTW